MDNFEGNSYETKESSCKLSLAIRLLLLKEDRESDIVEASLLNDKIFIYYVHMYVEEKETYNFHSVRHVSDQVRQLGPLCSCSVFAFTPVKYLLVRAFSVTKRRPERIADRSIRNKYEFFN